MNKRQKYELQKIKNTFLAMFLLISFCCLNTFINSNIAYCENATYFARITNPNTSLYFDKNDTSPILTLPNTYFVELISKDEDYYYAKYIDIYGYVKKDEVSPINGIPKSPFLLNVSFRVFVPSGANLRSSPSNNGATNLIYSIPFLDSNFLYYGEINGEEAISKKGTVWYFCKYYNNNIEYSGYVYSPLCDSLTTINPNTEEFEYISEDLIFTEKTEKTSLGEISNLSSTAQTLIVVAISLPCLLFIYLLFKPTMIAESKSETSKKSVQKRKKKKISRLKNSDYFEFDDDDFF